MKRLVFAAVAAAALAAGAVEDGFTSLFDGKTLDGWIVRGGENRFVVEDGCIKGIGVPSTCGINTFVTTKREYADFDFRVEFRIESGNSGVQFRSAYRTAYDPKWDWGPFKTGLQKVYGYQAEITPGGGCTGRIYDEERRGYRNGIVWLDTGTPKSRIEAAEKSFRKGGWNEMRVLCEGPRIRTYLNGNLVADLLDDMGRKGFIGLQMHLQGPVKPGETFKPGVAWWRNVRIRELAPAPCAVKRLSLDRDTSRRAQNAGGTNDVTVIESAGRTVVRLNGFEVWDSVRSRDAE